MGSTTAITVFLEQLEAFLEQCIGTGGVTPAKVDLSQQQEHLTNPLIKTQRAKQREGFLLEGRGVLPIAHEKAETRQSVLRPGDALLIVQASKQREALL